MNICPPFLFRAFCSTYSTRLAFASFGLIGFGLPSFAAPPKLAPAYIAAKHQSSPIDQIRVSSAREQSSITPGQSFWLSIELSLPQGVYAGWCLPLGDWPATLASLQLPKPLYVKKMLWPVPNLEFSGDRPHIFLSGPQTLLIEIGWKITPGEPIGSRIIPPSLMEAQLLIEGQARQSSLSLPFSLTRLVMLPAIRLPSEVPHPVDPLTLSGFKRAKARLPIRLDSSQVTWIGGQENIQIRIEGGSMNNHARWVGVAYRLRSDIVDLMPTAVTLLTHTRAGDIDLFTLPRAQLRQWLQVGVEEILLLDEKGDQAWAVPVENELASLSLSEPILTAV